MSDPTKLAQRITPGEWRAFGNLIRSGAKTVAKVCVLTDENEEQANVELIAFAPDILAERDMLVAQNKLLCAIRDQSRNTCDKLRAALSRHGRHDNDCPLRHKANLPGDSRCTCGFSASLT